MGKCVASCAISFHQRKRHGKNPLADVVVHRQQSKAERLHRREGVSGDRDSCGRLGCCRQAGNRELSEATLSRRRLRTAGARKAASSCAVRPKESSAVRGVKWQRSGSRCMLSERQRAVRPAACVIWSQKGAGRFNDRSSDTVQGGLGVPWPNDAHTTAVDGGVGDLLWCLCEYFFCSLHCYGRMMCWRFFDLLGELRF
ncbi:hypothetical protein TcG_13037 [Trypanosoma cruzi]|nr:hypothetical protein TcG_13037 [Trypanosoma cruzi]